MRYLLIALMLSFGGFAKADYDSDAAAALALAAAKLKQPVPADPVFPPIGPVKPTPIPGNIGDGHTHTCANGHTWNHAVNASHTCPVCGLSQFIQDPSPRAVNLGNSQYNLGSSGCANGQCGTVSQPMQRTGIFGRRR